MSGRATFTIELSITCMRAASTTAKAMRYLCGSPRSAIAVAGAASSTARSGSAGLAVATALSRSGLAKALPGCIAARLSRAPLACASRAILGAAGCAPALAPFGERLLDAGEDEVVHVLDIGESVTHDAR